MSKAQQLNPIIEKRIDMDLLDRSLVGIFIYSILLPVVFYFYHFYEQQPQLSWLFTILMAGISLLRLIHKIITPVLYQYSAKTWLILFSFLSLSQACILGVVFLLSISDPRFTPISNIVFFALGGVAGGAITALLPRFWLAVTNLSLLLIPAAFIAITTEGNTGYAVLVSIYFCYLFSLTFRSNREYIRAFYIECQLEAQQEELLQLNKIDPLTHIFNRGHFNTAYEHQWNIGIRNQLQQSLLLIDIDKFKDINDNYGHLFGDECLVFIAKLIHDTAKRKTDIIARFGGEEFTVLLSDTSLDDAVTIAENIRKKIANQPFIMNDTQLTLTVSIGVASMVPQHSINSNQLIENADKKLYLAKDNGRNQVQS